MNNFTRHLKRAAPMFLSILGAAGVVGTAVMSARAAPKALRLLQESTDEKREPLTNFEKFQVAAPAYISTALIGGSTIMCIFGSNMLSRHQQAALTSAYALTANAYRAYKDKVKELCGEETHRNVMDAIAKEKCEDVYISAPGFGNDISLNFDEADPSKNELFYDSFSERYFESTRERVVQAEYHLNRNFALGENVTLNEFYRFLGLTPIDGGEMLDWSRYDDIYWIDFDHRKILLDDGLECYVIDVVFEPYTDDI